MNYLMGKNSCVFYCKNQSNLCGNFVMFLVVFLRDHNLLTSSITNITEAIVRTVELNRSSKYCGKEEKIMGLDSNF